MTTIRTELADGRWVERVYNKKTRTLTVTYDNGGWYERKYYNDGKILSYKNSAGEYNQYDNSGKITTCCKRNIYHHSVMGDIMCSIIRTTLENNRWTESIIDQNGHEIAFRNSEGFESESTYDERGNKLTFKNNQGYSFECTYDDHNRRLTYKSGAGVWYEYTYNEQGKVLTYRDSNGMWSKSTYDTDGNRLSYRSSRGSSLVDTPMSDIENVYVCGKPSN